MQINYYDFNSEQSCKIIGTISLQKTKIATNLNLIIIFVDKSIENGKYLTPDWLSIMISIKIESLSKD